jgi:hypothetical protein
MAVSLRNKYMLGTVRIIHKHKKYVFSKMRFWAQSGIVGGGIFLLIGPYWYLSSSIKTHNSQFSFHTVCCYGWRDRSRSPYNFFRPFHGERCPTVDFLHFLNFWSLCRTISSICAFITDCDFFIGVHIFFSETIKAPLQSLCMMFFFFIVFPSGIGFHLFRTGP